MISASLYEDFGVLESVPRLWKRAVCVLETLDYAVLI